VDRLGPEGFAELLPKAERIRRRWAARLGDTPELKLRFWARFYQAGLSSMRPLDLQVCEDLDDLARHHCQEAGAASYHTALERAFRDVGAYGVLCSRAPDGQLVAHFNTLGPQTEAQPHALLEEVAREFQDFSCLDLQGPHGGPR